MKKYLLLVMCSVCLAGCSTATKIYSLEDLPWRAEGALEGIDLSDGANQEEADILSRLYLSEFINDCGTSGEIDDKGGHWEIELIEGYAADRMKDKLRIDKETGRMTLRKFPTVNGYGEI